MSENLFCKERQEEIERYIQNDDLDMATKRLMDFVSDFSNDSHKKREAIDIRAFHTNIRNNSLDLENKKLISQILLLKETIVDECNTQIKNNHPKVEEDIVFSAKGLSKIYKSKSIGFSFKAMDLDLKYGEITALVGENGNGKSTLLNMVAGELRQSAGTLDYPTLKGNKQKDWYELKTQIAYIHQELPKWQGLLRDNLHFILGVNAVKGQDNIDEVDFIIQRLGLEKYSNAKWDEISSGFKLRFSLAKALLRKPKLLILDEPLANLDISTQSLFLSDLRDLTKSLKHKMSVIISSQNLYEVEAVAENIIFLRDGEALYNGSVKDFAENREENSYEVDITLCEEALLRILDSIAYISSKKEGQNYIITTERSVTDKVILELFLANNISIKYFRNISQSTRKLFGEKK